MQPPRALLCLLLLACAAAPAARADSTFGEEQVADSPYPAEFRARVNAAIDRGVAHLRRTQRADGSWPAPYGGYPMGPTALATLTLLKCGVKPDDPAITRAFAFLEPQPLLRTYEVGVLLMALAARYAPAHETFEADEVDRYGKVKTKDPCASLISKADLAWMKRGVEFLVDNQNGRGLWRYPSSPGEGAAGDTDLSNTQYALLGLQAANRCGSLVPAKVWQDALAGLLKAQEAFGKPVLIKGNEVRGRYRFQWSEPALARGFRYVPGTPDPVTGSMTTAGLAGLIICQSELWGSRRFTGELRLDTRRAIRDAMAWMQANYDVASNPVERADGAADGPPPGFGRRGDVWHLYYLYGLERAGILGRFRYLGPNDWYLDGAEVLLDRQMPQGSFGSNVDTCFALLFLKRATSRHAAPVITPSEQEPAPQAPAAPGPPPTKREPPPPAK